MRKAINKTPRGDKSEGKSSGFANKRILASKKNITIIPAYTTVDDEEYFFEVEDF